MLKKSMSNSDIDRFKVFCRPGRFFYIKLNDVSQENQWEFRVFSTPYSNKGVNAGRWRTRIIAYADNLDELREYAREVLPELTFIRIWCVDRDDKKNYFFSEAEAFKEFKKFRMECVAIYLHSEDIWLDEFPKFKSEIKTPEKLTVPKA